jgi:GTPase SAR1 family protein
MQRVGESTCLNQDLIQIVDIDIPQTDMLKERYKCPHFRILVIGRANAGKTTILEKVCGVQQGTKPIIYDENGKLNQSPS